MASCSLHEVKFRSKLLFYSGYRAEATGSSLGAQRQKAIPAAFAARFYLPPLSSCTSWPFAVLLSPFGSDGHRGIVAPNRA